MQAELGALRWCVEEIDGATLAARARVALRLHSKGEMASCRKPCPGWGAPRPRHWVSLHAFDLPLMELLQRRLRPAAILLHGSQAKVQSFAGAKEAQQRSGYGPRPDYCEQSMYLTIAG